MNHKIRLMSVGLVLLLLVGCGAPVAAPTSVSPTATATLLPPTATLAPPTSTPKPAITPTPTEAEEQAWREIQCLDSQSLQEFLTAFPEGTYANDAELYLSLFQEIADIKSGLKEPSFVIPFDTLGDRWQDWKQRLPDKGAVGYYAAKESGNIVLGASFLFPGCGVISFDAYGTLVTPTGDGSVVTFKTNGLEFEYLNSIVIESSGEEILYFAIIENVGLVHLHGRGMVTMPDGSETEFN